ncbi:hypothetical protein JB92DRAFT_2831082 [Gautieria morchelliformis]|nr:hypothetical protein JB92DRAFT_2831082 [Gautieria morchelliformis]
MSRSLKSTTQVLRGMAAAATKILEAMTVGFPTYVDIGLTTEVAKRLSDIYQRNSHYLRLKFEDTFRTVVEKLDNMAQAPGMTPVEGVVTEFFDTLHTLYKDTVTVDGWAKESMDLARSHLAARANRTQSK